MNFSDITIIILTLTLYKPMQFALFGYWQMPLQLHSTYDIYGSKHKERMLFFDKTIYSRWTLPIAATLIGLLLLPLNPWPKIDPLHLLMPVVVVACFTITWWCLTRDFRANEGKERLYLALFFTLILWHPAFLPLFLLVAVSSLRAWEHHMQMCLRVLLTLSISLLLFGVGDLISELTDLQWTSDVTVASITLTLLCVSEHYFISGLWKLTLGKYPWSWALNNQIHQLCRSAYAYGWMRCIDEKSFAKVTNRLKSFNIPLQLSVLIFELLFGVALISREFSALLIFVAVLFHLGYFLFTGAFFWQNILLLSALFVTVLKAPVDIFNPFSMALGILLGLPFLRVWQVNKLGWWDTPFVNRLEWTVTGESGKRYNLPAEFFCPDERIFSLQKKGLHLCNEKVVTNHLGETYNEALAYTLIYTASNLKQLPKIVETYGIDYYSPSIRSMYIQYLKDFFLEFNEKGKKNSAPSWLKAPGTEWKYEGRFPNFKGLEKASELEVTFVREYFTDKSLLRVYEKPILRIPFYR